MARKLQYCQKIRCGRADKHRTRRVDADGRPDCLGNHGQCGMAMRGMVKTQAEEKCKRVFRVAKRLRSKLPPDRVTYAFKLTPEAPGPLLMSVTPTKHTEPSALAANPIKHTEPPALAANHLNACACGELPLPSPPSPPPPPSSSQGARKPDASMFQIICEYIDKEETSDHLDEGQRHGLKAIAFQLSVSLSTHKACQSAFPTSASEALLTPPCVRRRRSWALAVLLTALGLSAHTPSTVTATTLARALEGDVTIRGNALKTQHSILNYVCGSSGCSS